MYASNAAIDLLVEKLTELGLYVVRIGHPARVTEQTLAKLLMPGLRPIPISRATRFAEKVGTIAD